MPTHRTPPWEKKRAQPAGAKAALTPENVAWARARAQAAGRRYPNLVDNLAAVRRQREAEQRGKFPRGLRDGTD